jgi:hypothetical protein
MNKIQKIEFCNNIRTEKVWTQRRKFLWTTKNLDDLKNAWPSSRPIIGDILDQPRVALLLTGTLVAIRHSFQFHRIG